MPARDGEATVVLSCAGEAPPLVLPGAYSWGQAGHEWTLRAGSDGCVRVTHTAVEATQFVLRLGPDGTIHLTDKEVREPHPPLPAPYCCQLLLQCRNTSTVLELQLGHDGFMLQFEPRHSSLMYAL